MAPPLPKWVEPIIWIIEKAKMEVFRRKKALPKWGEPIIKYARKAKMEVFCRIHYPGDWIHFEIFQAKKRSIRLSGYLKTMIFWTFLMIFGWVSHIWITENDAFWAFSLRVSHLFEPFWGLLWWFLCDFAYLDNWKSSIFAVFGVCFDAFWPVSGWKNARFAHLIRF